MVVACSDTEGSGGKCIVHEENANWMQRRGRLLECIKGSKALREGGKGGRGAGR